jgi:ABC-type polysaccharide/polyol phosphate transport system ATPase subunit
MTAIAFNDVTKSFAKHPGRLLLRDRIAHLLQPDRKERFFALKNVSFQVESGEGLAVVGPNGAGKSTLLSLVAGLARPDSGTVSTNGRIAALLELGSGFHPDLTGTENVRVNAALLGLSRKKTNDLFDSIVEFSGISDFIDEPLRTYSSGMVMRLAFSVAINSDPDILLIDEVLAVGDQAFQTKCFDKLRQCRREGKSLLCVSHAAGMVQELADHAIWLDHGELMLAGSLRDVVAAYEGSRIDASVRP